MRRLPGPADWGLGEGLNSGGPLRIVSGLAENTNSIICEGSSEPKAANGCPILHGRNHPPRGAVALGKHPDQLKGAPSGARPGDLVLFCLTLTYMDVL
jgi:hypothetical protein